MVDENEKNDEQALESMTQAPVAPQAPDVPQADMMTSPMAQSGLQSTEGHNLDLILDIPLEVTVELGRTRMLIQELLELAQGAVVELNKLAGEPMDILVNNKLVARGEAVVVNDKFGVRVTDIVSPLERVQKLSN